MLNYKKFNHRVKNSKEKGGGTMPTDADLNFRKDFYEESKRKAEESNEQLKIKKEAMN